MQYSIYEGNMERLEKKLKRIENKCNRYGNTDFKFEIIGTEYKEIELGNGKKINTKFYIVDVEGVARVNDWVFVATIQHKDNGNVIRQFNTDIEVPEKYRHTNSICEHCNCKRVRKDTYLVYNETTQEFKQVGKSCLNDFTNGLSAEQVTRYISWFDEVISGEAVEPMNCKQYYLVEDVLLNAVETVKHYGFVSKTMANESFNNIKTTTERVIEFMFPDRFGKYSIDIKKEMESIGYNAESDNNRTELKKILKWLKKNDNTTQYISNLKITVANKYCEVRDFGLLISLPSAYFKAFKREQDRLAREQRKADIKVLNADKQYIGNIGDRLDFDICSATCVTSFETDYGIMRIYRFETINGDVLIWKTSKFIEDIDKVKKIKATVKKHTEYNSEKQTELSRVKIVE